MVLHVYKEMLDYLRRTQYSVALYLHGNEWVNTNSVYLEIWVATYIVPLANHNSEIMSYSSIATVKYMHW